MMTICGLSAGSWVARYVKPRVEAWDTLSPRWTRGIQSAKTLAKREDTSIATTPVEAVAILMQQRGERHVEGMAGVSERAVDHIETMDGPEILNSVDEIEKLDRVALRTFGLKDDNAYTGFSLNREPFIGRRSYRKYR
jgi:hypothetical protein